MATETRTENDISAMTDSMGRVSLVNDNHEDHPVGPDGEPTPRTEEE